VDALSHRTTVDGDAARARILDAAERLFAARGYAGTTTRDIARCAGIQKRMVFYYFPRKDALYGAVLERIVAALVSIHEQFREQPAPVGLADAVEGIVAFTAGNLDAVKLLLREIIDDGPHLPALARTQLGPLFARGAAEVERNVARGAFHPTEPMHALVGVGGLTLMYFLMAPLLRRIWDRDPLAPEALAAQAASACALLLHGLVSPATAEGEGEWSKGASVS